MPLDSFAVSAPMITGQPEDQIDIAEGSDVPFMVTVTGSSLTFQWQKDGVDIDPADTAKYSGVDTNHLIVMNVGASDDGVYRCVVSNEAAAGAMSEGATLIVCKLSLQQTAQISLTIYLSPLYSASSSYHNSPNG